VAVVRGNDGPVMQAGKNIPPLQRYGSVSEFAFDDMFVVSSMRFGASLWEYYVEFWRCRHLDCVLVLVFEEMLQNLRQLLPTLVQFAGLGDRYPDGSPEAEATLDTVAEMCSKEFMMEHGAQFDESWCHKRLVELARMAEPEGFCPAPRVTSGHRDSLDADAVVRTHGRSPSLLSRPESIPWCRLIAWCAGEQAFLEKQWALQVTPHTGHATYADMVAELRLLR
jgi:hypothetical protein